MLDSPLVTVNNRPTHRDELPSSREDTASFSFVRRGQDMTHMSHVI